MPRSSQNNCSVFPSKVDCNDTTVEAKELAGVETTDAEETGGNTLEGIEPSNCARRGVGS
jgi:hypothetical protein